jgi:cytokinesis protein
MDTIFRKKVKPRTSSVSNQDLNERSVPYHKLGPSPRPPLPVGTAPQGLRGNAAHIISAPITNPSLATNGTELNLYGRPWVDGDRAHSSAILSPRPPSPSHSMTTADSSTLYDDSDKTRSQHRSKFSDASTFSSGRKSPSVADFGFHHSYHGANSHTGRPSSRNTSRSDNRFSQYTTHSLAGSESLSHYSTHLNQHLHLSRHGSNSGDEFSFPRPENDEDIEALFENIKRTRALGDMPNLNIDQKWHMVYSDEHIRWSEERQREEQARKQGESGQPASIIEGTPEWFIKKFMDRTITHKQASSLEVSLRSKEVKCAS